ncbi:MAG: hypothetical protein ACPG7F_19025 [Aggregatilineales bacterium]
MSAIKQFTPIILAIACGSIIGFAIGGILFRPMEFQIVAAGIGGIGLGGVTFWHVSK